MYQKLCSVSLLTVLVSLIPNNCGEMCIDPKRTLRCVVPENCPEKRVIEQLQCPAERVCCRKYRPNVYLPLRSTGSSRTLYDWSRPYGKPSTTPSTTTSAFHWRPSNIERELDEDAIYFPEDSAEDARERLRPEDLFGEIRSEQDIIDSELEDNKLFLKSKSDYYCRKYAELTIGYYHTAKSGHNKVAMDICHPSFMPLIVGGVGARFGEFPHMAALGFNKSFGVDYICGGTLISDNFILTAAHCIETRWGPPVQVFLGDLKLSSDIGVTVTVQRAIIHPDYKPPSLYNDIALLQLDRKLNLSLDLRPACLPSTFDEKRHPLEAPGTVTIATGWGRTGVIGESSETLQKIRLEVVDNAKCNEFYKADSRTDKLRLGIRSDLICAGGYIRRYHDTCQGDSGGPLQAFIPGKKCVLEVVGVTSFGKSCGTGVPGVYTKVRPFIPWIESHVWP